MKPHRSIPLESSTGTVETAGFLRRWAAGLKRRLKAVLAWLARGSAHACPT